MVITTKPPFKFYIWMLLTVGFITYLVVEGMILWGALFYGLFGIALLYWVVSGKDCRISLNAETLEITYNKTFWKKRQVSLKDLEQITFIQGDPFWKLMLISNKVERYYRSMDKLLLIRSSGREEVLINTNSMDLKILINHFDKTSQSVSRV